MLPKVYTLTEAHNRVNSKPELFPKNNFNFFFFLLCIQIQGYTCSTSNGAETQLENRNPLIVS